MIANPSKIDLRYYYTEARPERRRGCVPAGYTQSTLVFAPHNFLSQARKAYEQRCGLVFPQPVHA
jgi:hypothetical protein